MRYLNLHTHSQTGNPAVLEIVNQYPEEFDGSAGKYSIGVHPWRIDEKRLEQDLKTIEEKLSDENCLALGECGLDKRIDISPELQTEVFEIQLGLAQLYKKPMIIHCVAAFQEIIEIKNKLEISVPMIIHGFSKSAQLAKQLTDNGFYLSFGKWLLRNPQLEMVFQSIPDDKIFLETDTSEENIAQVYELAAKYKQMKVEEIKDLVARNFGMVFNYEL